MTPAPLEPPVVCVTPEQFAAIKALEAEASRYEPPGSILWDEKAWLAGLRKILGDAAYEQARLDALLFPVRIQVIR
jgi:hypothetical protein